VLATATFDHVSITGNTGTPLAPTAARVTDGDFGEAASIWTTSRVGIAQFTTSFTYQVHPGIGSADGMAFVIQGNSPNAVGVSGGGLGYTGIANSVAVKFDFFTANTHKSTTGLYLDGEAVDSPAGRAKQVFMDGNGIDFNNGDVFRITFTYDATNVLKETVTDTVTGATFTRSYNVDILAHVGGNVGYVGFTGGTGGQTATQDILTWTYQFTPPRPPEDDGAAPMAAGGGSAAALRPGFASAGGGSGVPQMTPLAASSSAPSSTLVTDGVLMNLTPTPVATNGSAVSVNSSSSNSSGWSAFQPGVLGSLGTDGSLLSVSMTQPDSSPQILDQLFADLGNGATLDPLGTDRAGSPTA
jgi:hypothetical protein